jgi:hypothetical protein
MELKQVSKRDERLKFYYDSVLFCNKLIIKPWSQVDIDVEKLHFCDANHTACHSSTSIASGGAELVASLAKVIRVSMNHHSSANNAVCSRQSNQTISDVDRSLSIIPCRQIAKVADVTFFVRGSSVGLAQRIEVGPSTDATCSRS